jgi:hypothetical protein
MARFALPADRPLRRAAPQVRAFRRLPPQGCGIGDLHTDLRSTEQRLQNSIDNLSLRLTVRLGAMIVVAIGALAAILKLA